MANISSRHDTLFRLQSFLTDARQAKTAMQKRWERRFFLFAYGIVVIGGTTFIAFHL
jgi:hypothetical protein